MQTEQTTFHRYIYYTVYSISVFEYMYTNVYVQIVVLMSNQIQQKKHNTHKEHFFL